MIFTTKAAKATKRDLSVSIFEAFAAFVVKFLLGSRERLPVFGCGSAAL
jgi:hypothetical protein